MPSNPNFSLKRLRRALDLAQPDMARRMGLSLRPYQQLELNPGKVRRRHVRLAESVALDVALEQKDPELAPASVRKKGSRPPDPSEKLSTKSAETRRPPSRSG
jgi:transcriptional regulator with XRE-family HTH domain